MNTCELNIITNLAMGGLANVEQLAFEWEHPEAISPQHTQPTHSERLGRITLPGTHTQKQTQTHVHAHAHAHRHTYTRTNNQFLP